MAIRERVEKNSEQVMSNYGLHHRVAEWFVDNIGQPTELQRASWESIKRGENVLVVSPTGTGKTLAAVIPGIDGLVGGAFERSGVLILHISPLKALGADLVKALKGISDGIGPLPNSVNGRGKKGYVEEREISVGIRTGDVSQKDRRRMLSIPPDILVTTPENLELMLNSKAREILTGVRHVIVDEVHEMLASKRGAMLSLNLEQLNDLVVGSGNPAPVRIGLSATVNPISRAANFIGGRDQDLIRRPVIVRKVDSRKAIRIDVRTLVEKGDNIEDVMEGITTALAFEMEESTEPVVVFHNTRSRAEEMAFSLRERGQPLVVPHHGSLGVDARREAEEGLKSGTLSGVVSSTSLELGIDLGHVSKIFQISSPKDPSRMIQRFGRSGHGLGRTSEGTIFPTGPTDLLDSLAVVQAALIGGYKQLRAPEEAYGVMAQFAVGLSLTEKGVTPEQVFHLARRAYPFWSLRLRDVREVFSLLSQRFGGSGMPTPRLWKDERVGSYHPRRGTRQAFYMNCGTIPRETVFKVIEAGTSKYVGDLSRNFGESLYEGDVFLLGSESYRVLSFKGSTVRVMKDPGAPPTIPSWSGEVLSRPATVAKEIYRLLEKGKIEDCWNQGGGIRTHLDGGTIDLFDQIMKEQREAGIMARANVVPVEHLLLSRGRHLYIFHLPGGRRVTELLGRVLAYGIRMSLGARVDFTASDDGFAIISPTSLSRDDIIGSFGGERFDKIALRLILGSSIFKVRFTNCLMKSLMVLGRFRGRETTGTYRRSRSESMYKLLFKLRETGEKGVIDGPVRGLELLAGEALSEVIRERMDLDGCRKFVKRMEEGKIGLTVVYRNGPPTPIGEGITREWRRELTPIDVPVDGFSGSRRSGPGMAAAKPHPEVEAVERIVGIGSVSLIDMVDGPSSALRTYDELAVEWGLGLEEAQKKADRLFLSGEMLRLESPLGPGFIPIVDLKPQDELPMDQEAVFRGRFDAMDTDSSLSRTLRSMPFFTHPMEVMIRSPEITYNDLRSAVRDGRIVPVHVCNGKRMADTQWAAALQALSSTPPEGMNFPAGSPKDMGAMNRNSLRKWTGLSGEELSDWIRGMASSNHLAIPPRECQDHLGAEPSYVTTALWEWDKEERERREDKAICDVIRRLGPFSLSELSRVFGWMDGYIPEGVLNAVRKGRLHLGLGPAGPIERAHDHMGGQRSIWVWDPRLDSNIGKDQGEKKVHGKRGEAGRVDFLILPGSDPYVLLTGQEPMMLERDRIRGGGRSRMVLLKRGVVDGHATFIETGDLLILDGFEVHDFSDVEGGAKALVSALYSYRSLGYEVSIIENLFGIPAGEAARLAVRPLLESDYKPVETPKGIVLARGAELDRDRTRENILRDIFSVQGLSPGRHWQHPLEVIQFLWGVCDQFELRSRLSTNRHRRLEGNGSAILQERSLEEWSNLRKAVTEGKSFRPPSWDGDLLKWKERLASIDDNAKRYSLWKGMTDQPKPVWGSEIMFDLLPAPSRNEFTSSSQEIRGRLVTLISSVDKGYGKGGRNTIYRKEIGELIRNRVLLTDIWGNVKTSLAGKLLLEGSRKGGRPEPTGIVQRVQILKSANSLGSFHFEDLVNYSPGISHPSKLRRMINELCGKHLRRTISVYDGYHILYDSRSDRNIRSAGSSDRSEERLVIISPRDRMMRVVQGDLKKAIPRGRGFALFMGGVPVAMLSLKKPGKKEGGCGADEAGAFKLRDSYMIMDRIWSIPRLTRKAILRGAKRAFISLGIRLVYRRDWEGRTDLYRETDEPSVGRIG